MQCVLRFEKTLHMGTFLHFLLNEVIHEILNTSLVTTVYSADYGCEIMAD